MPASLWSLIHCLWFLVPGGQRLYFAKPCDLKCPYPRCPGSQKSPRSMPCLSAQGRPLPGGVRVPPPPTDEELGDLMEDVFEGSEAEGSQAEEEEGEEEEEEGEEEGEEARESKKVEKEK
eukprot:scaffold293005_cov19-Tisochrysis_lutea.AAC.1